MNSRLTRDEESVKRLQPGMRGKRAAQTTTTASAAQSTPELRYTGASVIPGSPYASLRWPPHYVHRTASGGRLTPKMIERLRGNLQMLSQGVQRGALVDVFVARGVTRAQPGRIALSSAAREAGLAVAGVLALALSSRILIPVPYSPVPITGQTFAVLLLAAAYGARRGLASVALYLLAGAAGLPVFAAVPSMPLYGYLAGFALAAVIVGWLAERGWDRTLPASIGAMLAGEVAIYACGLLWLAPFVGWSHVIALGLTPYLLGDALKLVAAALLLPAAWLATRRVLGQEPR